MHFQGAKKMTNHHVLEHAKNKSKLCVCPNNLDISDVTPQTMLETQVDSDPTTTVTTAMYQSTKLQRS